LRKLEGNFHFLRASTGVHIHADLIVGLPGETIESFGAGFDRLVALGPQEIQVGILKRLRGTPIVRHDSEWQMRYNPHPPYEILQNKLIDFATMQRLRRFAKYWDLVGNSGNFVETTPLIWSKPTSPSPLREEKSGVNGDSNSPFTVFLQWSDWLHVRIGRTDSIALARLTELLFKFLIEERGLDPRSIAETLWRDYQRGGRTDKPECLRPWIADAPVDPASRRRTASLTRQARHLAVPPESQRTRHR
jgi:hypothetical protein